MLIKHSGREERRYHIFCKGHTTSEAPDDAHDIACLHSFLFVLSNRLLFSS